MKRTVGARYLPLAAIVAIQLLIVAVAPSTLGNQSVDTGGGAASGFTPDDSSTTASSSTRRPGPRPPTAGAPAA